MRPVQNHLLLVWNVLHYNLYMTITNYSIRAPLAMTGLNYRVKFCELMAYSNIPADHIICIQAWHSTSKLGKISTRRGKAIIKRVVVVVERLVTFCIATKY